MKLSTFFLKTEILLEFLRLGSKLSHSIITDGKREFLKKLCFVLIRGILLSVQVAHGVHRILSIYDLLFPPGMGALKGGTVRGKSFCEFLILALFKETLIQRNVGLLS